MNNQKFYKNWIQQGYKYIFNPSTQELHRLTGDNYRGSCHLYNANLENFIPLKTITIRDPKTGKVLNGLLNKCLHCFPEKPNKLLTPLERRIRLIKLRRTIAKRLLKKTR